MASNAKSRFLPDVFVGRRHETDLADMFLAEMSVGRGGALIVEGEPGVGKSRLVREISNRAASQGITVLLGRCHDGQAIPPYWPWVEILRTCYRDYAVPRDREKDIEAALRVLLPELRIEHESDDPVTDDAEFSGFLLADAVATYLKATAAETPLLLVLEDVHNADTASLNLVDTLSQSIEYEKIGLIATYRSALILPESRLAETVGDLAKLGNYQQIRLSGISSVDVSEFMRSAAGKDVPDEAVRAVFRHTDGNCLFVKELVRALLDEIEPGSSDPREIEAMVRHHSASLVPLIAKRLSRLPEKSKMILQTAALLGRDISFEKLSAVVAESKPGDIDEALDSAFNLAFLEYSPNEIYQYSFVHALYQDALTAELAPLTTARRRCAIGLALEEYYAGSADDHAVELASFLSGAETGLQKERCYHYSFQAGEQAWAKFAVDDMQSNFFGVYNLREFRKTEAELARIYQALVVAYAMMWRHEDSARMRVKAWDSYFESGETEKGLKMVTDFGTVYSLSACVTELQPALKRALSHAVSDSTEAATIMAYIAISEQFSGRESEADLWLKKSFNIAVPMEDPASRIIALESKSTVLRSFRKSRWDEFHNTIQDLIDQEASDPGAQQSVERSENIVDLVFEIGKAREVRAIAHRQLSQARVFKMPSAICRALRNIMISHRLEGNWEDARDYCEEALNEKKSTTHTPIHLPSQTAQFSNTNWEISIRAKNTRRP